MNNRYKIVNLKGLETKTSFPPLVKVTVVRSFLCIESILIYYSIIGCKAFKRILFGLNADK